MISHMSKATASLAEDVQHRHRADPEGWCGFHRKYFGVCIPAGDCKPWRLAQMVIIAYDQQQTRSLPQGPVAGQFWARET